MSKINRRKGISIADHIKANIKIIRRTGCWEWQRCIHPSGYGRIGIDYKVFYVHRISYELFVGKIPKGLDLDHLCRNRRCCNPEHLEPVTRSVNLRRGAGPKIIALLALKKTHCPKEHPYNKENTMRDSAGYRACRICRKLAREKCYKKHEKLYRATARIKANAYYWANREKIRAKLKERRKTDAEFKRKDNTRSAAWRRRYGG